MNHPSSPYIQLTFPTLYKQKQQLHIYLNRQALIIDLTEQQYLDNPDDYLSQINKKLVEQNEIIKLLSFKLINFMDFCLKIKQEYEQSFNQLNYQIQIKDSTIYNLQEANTHMEQKQQLYSQQYQNLRSEILTITDKISKQQTTYQTEIYKLIQNVKQLEQLSQKDKSAISTLLNEKTILIDQIKHERKINMDLSSELHEKKLKIQECGKLQRQYEGKVMELGKSNRQMQRVIEDRGLAIEKLENQIRGYKDYGNQKNIGDQNWNNVKTDFDEVENKGNPKCSLYEEMPFLQQQAPKTLCRNLSQLSLYTLKTYRKGSNDQDYKSTYKMVLDPYYAHFVLTSQSVKIRQDCQTLLNIDVKPFYKQIIEKRIPMHLWDQWIRNKLKQIIKQLKKTKPSELDEDYQQ